MNKSERGRVGGGGGEQIKGKISCFAMYKISLISLQLLFQFDMATDWVQNNHLSFFLKACLPNFTHT